MKNNNTQEMFANYPDVVDVSGLQSMLGNIGKQYYMSIFKDSYNKKYKDYVCLDELGNLRKPDYVSHKFKQILRNNDLREIRFHDLKHSCRDIACKERYFIKSNTRLAWSFKLKNN